MFDGGNDLSNDDGDDCVDGEVGNNGGYFWS